MALARVLQDESKQQESELTVELKADNEARASVEAFQAITSRVGTRLLFSNKERCQSFSVPLGRENDGCVRGR